VVLSCSYTLRLNGVRASGSTQSYSGVLQGKASIQPVVYQRLSGGGFSSGRFFVNSFSWDTTGLAPSAERAALVALVTQDADDGIGFEYEGYLSRSVNWLVLSSAMNQTIPLSNNARSVTKGFGACVRPAEVPSFPRTRLA